MEPRMRISNPEILEGLQSERDDLSGNIEAGEGLEPEWRKPNGNTIT